MTEQTVSTILLAVSGVSAMVTAGMWHNVVKAETETIPVRSLMSAAAGTASTLGMIALVLLWLAYVGL